MKNSTFLAIIVCLLLCTGSAVAQKTGSASPKNEERCGTMKLLAEWEAQHPDIVAGSRIAAEQLAKNPFTGNSNTRLNAIVTIPIVFHIVLPNPFIITDADLQAQVDRLNLDYSGLNPDSTNIPAAFQAVRGHSQLRFVLAKRTPTGQLTNGIERRASGTVYTGGGSDPIKSAAAGGLDAWDFTQYFNIWVGTGGGLLGYATFPGTSNASQQGVVTDIVGTASNPCFVDPNFNLGRTLTHEAGHYFGLYHIWGDENACATSDFRNLTGTCLITDTNLAGAAGDQTVGDTPNQGAATSGCPTGIRAGACGTANGDMYQNYMDYTNDACYSMFTIKQAGRMEWIVQNCRSGYITTQGGVAPTGAIVWDAAPQSSVNPGGFEVVGCTVTNYTDALSCAGSIAPKFRVTNRGVNTITSVVAGYRFNNGTAVSQTFTVNIPTGGSAVVSFASLAVGVGNHTFKFFTSSPNGNTDQVPANDTLTQAFRVMAPAVPPVTEGFEAAPPFTNFVIDNLNGDGTWVRTTPGRGASTGKLSIDNYTTDNTGTFDDLRSTSITVDPTRLYAFSFDVAHKYYPAAVNYDTLSVYVSGNCGQTYTRVFQKWGAALAGTAGSLTTAYTTPAAGDWRTETINLSGAQIASGQIVIVIRNSGRYGNWIHLDNVNMTLVGGRDLRLVSINQPGTTLCAPNFTPSVTVGNEGTETVTSFKVGYRVGTGVNTITTFNQSIAPGATATVTLPAGTAVSGNNVITAFTADPVSASGTGDARLSNDTLTKTVTLVNLLTANITEGFEGTFPPTGWTIFNPTGAITWIKRAPGRNSGFSAFIDNFSTNTTGQIDEMRLPYLNVAGADSVYITFDVAHKNYTGSNDVLSVLTTPDCASTFTTVYSKSGATLATAGASTAAYTAPTATEWRNERIAIGGTALASGNLGVIFRNTSAYGNNIFVDNVNIRAVYRRDLQLVSLNTPGQFSCNNTVTPAVTVRNVGLETITGFQVAYSINGGTAVTQTITGVTLAPNAQQNVTLPASTVTGTGNFNVLVYSLNPITVSGTGDQNTSNDTLRRSFFIPSTTTAPLAETFASTTFPPAGWSIVNPDGGLTWARSTVGNGNVGSAFLRTFNYPAVGQKDDLLTPLINFPGVDSVTLAFSVAASTYSYPGSTATPLDTLEVLVTRDCGATYTTVYKKWGAELQTVRDANSPQSVEFVPNSPTQWRRETVNISQFAQQSPLLVVFRGSNNYENNIYIDNVDVFTTTLPNQLKQQGYLIYPTAFRQSFTVRYFQDPATLRYVNVMNAAGQLVWSKKYNNSTERQITVDLNGRAAGVYFVELGYQDPNRNVMQRVTKF